MTCQDCPQELKGPLPPKSVAYLVYTGGPADAQFRLLGSAIPQPDDQPRIYKLPTADETGTLRYPADGPVPPCPEGFERDAKDPFVLKPVWPACSCQYRMLQVGQAVEGHLYLGAICITPLSEHVDQTVTMDTCNKCPVRTPVQTGQ